MLIIQTVPIVSLADGADGHFRIAFSLAPATFSAGLACVGRRPLALYRVSHTR